MFIVTFLIGEYFKETGLNSCQSLCIVTICIKKFQVMNVSPYISVVLDGYPYSIVYRVRREFSDGVRVRVG